MRYFFASLIALAGSVGCANGQIADDIDPGTDGGTTAKDGSTTTEGGGGCTMMCSGMCADTKTDPSNCGKCGTVCPMGATCVQGSCQCGMGQMKCGAACVDTKTDMNNCGTCGNSCADAGAPMGGGTWGCVNGVCTVMCPMGKTDCSGSCVDTKTDKDNCGMCGNACMMTETCLSGLCCPTGNVLCNNACTDTNVDPNNCGMCGTKCSGNTPYCTGGMCTGGVTYTKMFTGSQPPPAQHCTDWNTFRASLTGSYSSITVYGSNDNVGKTCTGNAANQLCQALKSGQATNVMCNGDAWYAGICTTGIEISANGQCTCSSQYTLRPCINHQDWGGVKTTSCGAPSQTMSVTCK